MKTCIKCKVDKEESQFPFKNKSKGILSNTCKECQREYGKSHYKRHVKYYVSKAKKGRTKFIDNLRQKMLEYLIDKKCQNCGESDPIVLEFDHRNPEEKSFTISDISRKSWKRTLKEIEKCDILCSNCHRRKTAKDRNWYRFVNR